MSKTVGSIVFVARGPAFDVDAFLLKFAFVRPSEFWRRGDQRIAGRVARESGFKLKVPTDPSFWDESVKAFEDELRRIVVPLAALREMGVHLSVGFPIFQHPNRISHTLRFPTSLLALLAERGVELGVSSYACSNEAEPLPMEH